MISISYIKSKILYLTLILVVFIALVACLNRTCQARVYININAPYLRKIPTAIPIFKDMTAGQNHTQLAKEFSDLLAETLKFTGFFKILDHFIEFCSSGFFCGFCIDKFFNNVQSIFPGICFKQF